MMQAQSSDDSTLQNISTPVNCVSQHNIVSVYRTGKPHPSWTEIREILSAGEASWIYLMPICWLFKRGMTWKGGLITRS